MTVALKKASVTPGNSSQKSDFQGFYGFSHDPGSQTGQAKPNQYILGPYLGLFDPFLGQKYQKTTVTKLSEQSPSIYTYGQIIFW